MLHNENTPWVAIHLTVIHDVFLQKAVDWLLKENTIIVKYLLFDGDFRSECASIMRIWQLEKPKINNVDKFDYLYYQIAYHGKIICPCLPAVC
jgi:hypothetical protein